jgi:hypothetical protein
VVSVVLRESSSARWILLVGGMLAAVCAASCAEPCDAASAHAALDAARPGDTVRLGACRIEGPLVVPGGVSLVGAGRGRTIVHASEGDVITVGFGEPRIISDLTIESDGERAFAAGTPPNAHVTIARVDVRATRGVGVDLTGTMAAILTDVDIAGPVTAENASTIPADAGPADTAVIGLDARQSVSVDHVMLENVSIHGFAGIGARLYGVSSRWTGGVVSGNLGTGILAMDTGIDLGITLEDVEVRGTMRGRRDAAFGIVVRLAGLSSSGVTVCDNEGYGFVEVENFFAAHTGLTVARNAGPGVWIQDSYGAMTTLRGSTISDNHAAGVVIVSGFDVAIEDSAIERTVAGNVISREGTMIEIADGLHAVDPDAVALQDVSFADNTRVGILLDIPGDTTMPPDLTFDRVGVDATGDARGAILQNAIGIVPPGGWDDGITRTGAATADATLTAPLDVLAPIPTALLPQ